MIYMISVTLENSLMLLSCARVSRAAHMAHRLAPCLHHVCPAHAPEITVYGASARVSKAPSALGELARRRLLVVAYTKSARALTNATTDAAMWKAMM